MSGQQDAEEYFNLIQECAIKTMGEMPVGNHPDAFWRQRVGKAWRNVYHHMTKPSPQLAAGLPTAYRREMALRFAALSREAAMAAYILGIRAEVGEVEWERMAKRLIEMGQQMPPFI